MLSLAMQKTLNMVRTTPQITDAARPGSLSTLAGCLMAEGDEVTKDRALLMIQPPLTVAFVVLELTLTSSAICNYFWTLIFYLI
jgi:hypothetical protein